jgi:Uma2 family endonuclease
MSALSSLIPEFPRAAQRRMRYAEYMSLVERGFYAEDQVELIDGQVITMSPIGEAHTMSMILARGAIERAFGPEFTIRPQVPLGLPATDSCPQPDLAVVRGSPRDHMMTPTFAVLVVEISATTLAYDLEPKAVLYALAGIPEYWVIDLNSRTVIVHREPMHGRYGSMSTLPPGQTVLPLGATAAVAVEAMLP